MTVNFFYDILDAVITMTKREQTCCFTGHRRIPTEDLNRLPQKLDLAVEALAKKGVTRFICGGALGFDTLAAEAVLRGRERLGIQLFLVIPCRGQSVKWTRRQQEQYDFIRSLADGETVLAEVYDKECMMRRNRFMVEQSGHCVCYLTEMRGGTYQTVSYAMEQNLKLYHILSKME